MNFRTEAESVNDMLRELTRATTAFTTKLDAAFEKFGPVDEDNAEQMRSLASIEMQRQILFTVVSLSVTVRDLLRALPADTVD